MLASALGEERWIPLVLALVALLLRLPHLGWGLPDIEEEALPLRKAFAMSGWGTGGRIELDPHTAGWPSLSFYVHMTLQQVHYGVGRLLGLFADRGDYWVAYWLDPGPLLRLSRAIGVGAASGIVWIGARLGQRLAGRGGAVLAGGLLALSPLLAEHAQLVEPDILMALCVALAVSRLLDIQRRGSRADYLWAGVWIGLGISCKYTPVLLLPAVFVAHATGSSTGGRNRLLDSRPWSTVGAAVIAFAATSPFLILRFDVLVRDVGGQALHLTGGHFGQGAATGAFHYLVDVLPRALGPVGFVVSLVCLALAGISARGPWLVLLSVVFFYYTGLAALATQFDRYILPLLLPLSVGLAGLDQVLKRFGSRGSRVILFAAGTAAFVGAAWGTWKYHEVIGRPSTQALANQYARELADAQPVRFLAEVLSLSLPTARFEDEVGSTVLPTLSPSQRERVAQRPTYEVDYLPMYTVHPEASSFYYDLHHAIAHDLVVVSDAVRGRYLAEAARFPAQVRFYADLERFGKLVHRVPGAVQARGPEIRFYRLPPDSVAAFLRTRGASRLEEAFRAAGQLSPSELLPFVEGVGRAALARGYWGMAEHYYGLLLDAGSRAGMDQEQQVALTRMLAAIRARAETESSGTTGPPVDAR